MKPGDDKALNEALSRWKVDSPLPPRFRERVWGRIAESEASRTTPFGSLCASLVSMFGRRSFAVSCIAILVMMGLLVGLWHGHSQQRQVQALLAGRYVQTVASYQSLP